MGLVRRVRTAGAVAIVAVGVPTLVLGSMSHGQAGTLPSGTTAGSNVPTLGRTALNNTGTTTTTTTGGSTSSGSTSTGNLPADKMTVAASDMAISGPGADVTLLSAQMRTSTPADLLFQVTAECSIITQVTTMGNDSQTAFGQIRMWITIDGTPVAVVHPAGSKAADDGRVVFCNRTYSSTTSGFSEAGGGNSDPQITTYEATKAANAFNWVSFNVGNGIHTIQLHAELTKTDTNNATSNMIVGDRTLVVDTTQTAQNQVG